jgi:hypothetical protein
MTPEFLRKMNEIADGSKSDIQPPTDDTTFERKSRDLVKLYQVSDESGALTVTEAGGYPLKRELLDSKVCEYMVHTYMCVLYTCVHVCVLCVYVERETVHYDCHRMLSFWTLVLVVSLLGLVVGLPSRKRRLPSKMLS